MAVSKRFRARYVLAHQPYIRPTKNPYPNLDVGYMNAVCEAQDWLLGLRIKFFDMRLRHLFGG